MIVDSLIVRPHERVNKPVHSLNGDKVCDQLKSYSTAVCVCVCAASQSFLLASSAFSHFIVSFIYFVGLYFHLFFYVHWFDDLIFSAVASQTN